jgi:signal transduction histidine kinase
MTLLFSLSTYLSWRFYQADRINRAAIVLVGGTVLSLNISFLSPTYLNSFFPYLFLIVIAIAGLIISPNAALTTAIGCVISSIITVSIGYTEQPLSPLLAPNLLGLSMALITRGAAENLITAFHWALISQSRAQSRRDELFDNQQKLKKAYLMLETSNIRLKEAQERADEANALKTKFVTNLSHELRTPLNAIINFSFILARGRYGQLNEDQINYLNRIQGAGEHLLGIVNDLLDFAKVESGEMDLFIETVDSQSIAREALEFTEGLLGDKKVATILDMPAELPPLQADSMRLRQIMLNLLSNAAKYTDSGSISLTAEIGPEYITFAIKDTGIGIRANELDNIFKEFHQTQEALNHKRIGTGLGLPISRRLVEMHGGQLWVESTVNVGSCFYFTLPLSPQPPQGA